MILTPIPLPDLPAALDRFDRSLTEHPLAQTVFRRIAATVAFVDGEDLSLSQDPLHHRQAVALLREFDMGIIEEPPTAGFTWDGASVRVLMEPSVIIHEVAHLQLCARERRTVWDFGLGAGPETGRREDADRVMSVFGLEREMEESLTSLLGILWEVELQQPAILAYLEQNWLEGYDRPHNRQHFLKVVGALAEHGFLDGEGRPTRALREIGDEVFLRPLVTP
jgi:hypothetical protein